MSLIADGLLILAGFAAATYCLVLSRRIRRLTNSGEGIGAEIEKLNRSIAEVQEATKRANHAAEEASKKLVEEIRRASTVTAKLEILMRKVKQNNQQPAIKDFLATNHQNTHEIPEVRQKRSLDLPSTDEIWEQEDGIERHDHAIYSKADVIAEFETTTTGSYGPNGRDENAADNKTPVIPDSDVLSVKRLPI